MSAFSFGQTMVQAAMAAVEAGFSREDFCAIAPRIYDAVASGQSVEVMATVMLEVIPESEREAVRARLRQMGIL